LLYLIETVYDSMGEPLIAGSCHYTITFDPDMVVVGAIGVSGLEAASTATSAEYSE